MTARHPYRLGPDRRLVRADEDQHLADLVRLVLLTGSGERLHRPGFGPGLAATALFEPLTDLLPGLIEMRVKGALEETLGDRLVLRRVEVARVEGGLVVTVAYQPRARPGPEATAMVRLDG